MTVKRKIDSSELQQLRALVVDLNVQWQMFDELFSGTKNNALFDRTGPNFWIHLRTYLIENILQGISRFFDPAASKSQLNLSLAAVTQFKELAAIRPELERQLAAMRPIWERGIKVWRHKKLSHSDMPTALGKKALPSIPIREVKELVSEISEFARKIDHRLNHQDVSYHIGVSHWVPQVLGFLEQGVRRMDEAEKRLTSLRSRAGVGSQISAN